MIFYSFKAIYRARCVSSGNLMPYSSQACFSMVGDGEEGGWRTLEVVVAARRWMDAIGGGGDRICMVNMKNSGYVYYKLEEQG